MTAEARGSHSRPTRASSVTDPECVGFDLRRWENEGGALIETEFARSAAVCCSNNGNLQTDSPTVQLTNPTSPNGMLTGRAPCGTPTALQVRDASTCSMRLSRVHLKVRDLNHSIPFYTSILGLRLTEHTRRYAFLATGRAHHCVALEECGALTVAPSRYAVGMSRVGFEVPDRVAFVATHDRLLRAGMPIINGDNGISWVMRFEDPDGNEIEIYLDRRKAPDGTALWEGRWQTFKIPKPFALPRSAKPASRSTACIKLSAPLRDSVAAKVARHRQPAGEGPRQTEDVLK